MKQIWIIAIPLAFAAGIVTTVVLQQSGWIYLADQSNPRALSSAQSKQLSARPGSSSTTTSDTTLLDLETRLSGLQKQIQTARMDRESIRAELETLREFSTDHSESLLPDAVTQATVTQAPVTQTSRSDAQPAGITGRRNRGRFGDVDSQQQFNGLLAAGVDQTTATEIKQRGDQWELARLDLIDTASREGWRRSDEFGAKMRELRAQQVNIRDEIGDDAYDAYLFAAGENNRIQIETIIDGSAAQLAGIELGDVVVSYADATIYHTRELQNATRDGLRSESISVVVLRRDSTLIWLFLEVRSE